MTPMKPTITGSNSQKKSPPPTSQDAIPARPSIFDLLLSAIKWRIIFISVAVTLLEALLFLYLWNACFGTVYAMGYLKCLGVLVMTRILTRSITSAK